ncbi:hypothetical protein AC578_8767 [Pseudocercospora eumusae]|uniref:Uncharacterized protein n=1 Tax=Pseudocercospora eumusae TaxID=321146 RepID=A0A139H6C6_9PEZI|nr:hypothetical protein AC578_8767 [Pseudocercospora eumusae]
MSPQKSMVIDISDDDDDDDHVPAPPRRRQAPLKPNIPKQAPSISNEQRVEAGGLGGLGDCLNGRNISCSCRGLLFSNCSGAKDLLLAGFDLLK